MGELACDGLTKVYGGTTKALDSVSFSVRSRGTFALIGRNGAGKTTLVRILATELQPTSGSATIEGLDIGRDAKRLRERLAIVPQEARAISWMTPKQTAVSYLLWRGFTYGEAKKRATESLARLGLEKYSDVLNGSLSGGTKRKVLVATVIASEADLVFLDEPTTGLDPISRRELWETLKEVGKDRFTFLTTHYMEEAEQLADMIGMLKDGRLVATGSLNDLRRSTRYQYSIRLPTDGSFQGVDGEVRVGEDGYSQLLTDEAEAFRVSKRLLEDGVRFSMSPVSLEEIFFHLVGHTGEDD